MNFSYGPVTMRVNTVQQEVNAVYTADGVDYLYTHVRTTVNAVWSPVATSNAGATAVLSLGGPTTVAGLRSTLMTPRLPLIVSVEVNGEGGESILLRSPLFNANGSAPLPCDAKNGPLPVGEPVIQLIGERAAIVQFTVETWVVECSPNLRPLLSHRWEMDESIDQDMYTTRRITGEAYFRSDWMIPQGASADDFRTYLFHPIPNMFRRVDVQVKLSSDNTKLSYILTDKEDTSRMNFTQYPNITRAYGYYSRGTAVADWKDFNLFAIPDAMAMFGAGAQLNALFFPKLTLSIQIHIVGNRLATKNNLAVAMANVLANFKFGTVLLLGTDVSKFLTGMEFTYSMCQERKLIGMATGSFSANAQGLLNMLGVSTADNELDLTEVTPLTFRGPPGAVYTGIPADPKNSGGTTIVRMIAQALGTPCATPAAPPAVPTNPRALTPPA